MNKDDGFTLQGGGVVEIKNIVSGELWCWHLFVTIVVFVLVCFEAG